MGKNKNKKRKGFALRIKVLKRENVEKKRTILAVEKGKYLTQHSVKIITSLNAKV